jgi:hypothetical protein
MARMFSLDFEYKDVTYTAVVTIIKADSECPISVYLPDTELHYILPDGKVTFNSPQELQMDTNKTAPVQELLNCILTALKAHEENTPPVGLW